VDKVFTMATKVPAKSILKQPTAQPTLSDEQKATAETNRKHLNTALWHANKIQHRKDVEARIFGNIETLLEFPSANPFTSVDVSRFTSLVRSFQPSDFDNLIEERRIDGKCGYALCSNAPRTESLGTSAAWKLKAKAASDYCSDDCTRKSLYVKTQLNEVPAWERDPAQHPKVVVHLDDRASATRVQPAIATRAVPPRATQNDLALERGDTTSSMRPSQVMTSTVVEHTNTDRATTRPPDAEVASHTAIEGYEPTSGSVVMQPPKMSSVEAVSLEISIAEPSTAMDDEEADSWRDLFSNVSER